MNKPSPKEPPEIRIDRDGVWYYRDMEMTRSEIVQDFYRHLQRDARGDYRIVLDHDECPVQVEDAPYVVRSVSPVSNGEGEKPVMILTLSDGSREVLEPETVRIGAGNVLYCSVKNREHDARFSRQAYYQLAENIRHDPRGDLYCIEIGGCSYPLDLNPSKGGFHVR